MSDLIRREDAYDMVRNAASMSDALDAIDALPAVQPDARINEYEEAYQYALHLAEALRENYPPNPDFRFLGDLVGLLTQIDNMLTPEPWNPVTSPSMTDLMVDPDQMREDREERAMLAREDDQ